ncbi:MAG: hypothetical protein SF051_14805 [Elusimicrobiota bacterium]|nr:hypothetical protein [Elusimicrobiota bacterium]
MDIPLVLLADYANVSREGKLNVLGIFTTIHARNFPAIHPQLQIVIMWEASRTESGRKKKLEIQLRDQDGGKMFAVGGEFVIPEGVPGKRIQGNNIVVLNGVKFEKPGDYTFHVLINDEEKGEAVLAVAPILPAKQS